jgi:hypothetical protein
MTSKVTRVDDSMPAITKVANGRCTSAAVPPLSALSSKLKLATKAIIRRGTTGGVQPGGGAFADGVIQSAAAGCMAANFDSVPDRTRTSVLQAVAAGFVHFLISQKRRQVRCPA